MQDLFAEKRLPYGTTTCELAAAAGVSEALLFKHFPSKEALYQAILEQKLAQNNARQWPQVLELPASTETLVLIIRGIVVTLVDRKEKNPEGVTFDRILLRSLCEDGNYARLLFGQIGTRVTNKISACLQSAAASGDLDCPAPSALTSWFAQYVPLMCHFAQLPSPPAIDHVRAIGT